jgi:hypothetical protein
LTEGGQERAKLIQAAHTLIVVSANFEALEGFLGKKALASLEVTDHEKLRLISGLADTDRDDVLGVLYEAEVPAPSAAIGFRENLAAVARWNASLTARIQTFIAGIDAWRVVSRDLTPVISLAVERYEPHFLALGSTVVEFKLWSQLGEHAATRRAVRELSTNLGRALESQGRALQRLEELLKLVPGIPKVEETCSKRWVAITGVC